MNSTYILYPREITSTSCIRAIAADATASKFCALAVREDALSTACNRRLFNLCRLTQAYKTAIESTATMYIRHILHQLENTQRAERILCNRYANPKAITIVNESASQLKC